jgi:hypothetical protein
MHTFLTQFLKPAMNANMPNQNHIAIATRPESIDELLDAARHGLARGLARLAKRENASTQSLELVQRALYHRDLIALKRRELDLVRQRLDQDLHEFNARNTVRPRPRRRLLAIEVQPPMQSMFDAQSTNPACE